MIRFDQGPQELVYKFMFNHTKKQIYAIRLNETPRDDDPEEIKNTGPGIFAFLFAIEQNKAKSIKYGWAAGDDVTSSKGIILQEWIDKGYEWKE
jgi:hypothetical protein